MTLENGTCDLCGENLPDGGHCPNCDIQYLPQADYQARLDNRRANMVQLFDLGQVVATQGAIAEMEELFGDSSGGANAHLAHLIRRHMAGDWGNSPQCDGLLNDKGIEAGDRLHSSYELGGVRFWVITEWDRSVTTILLPDEY